MYGFKIVLSFFPITSPPFLNIGFLSSSDKGSTSKDTFTFLSTPDFSNTFLSSSDFSSNA